MERNDFLHPSIAQKVRARFGLIKTVNLGRREDLGFDEENKRAEELSYGVKRKSPRYLVGALLAGAFFVRPLLNNAYIYAEKATMKYVENANKLWDSPEFQEKMKWERLFEISLCENQAQYFVDRAVQNKIAGNEKRREEDISRARDLYSRALEFARYEDSKHGTIISDRIENNIRGLCSLDEAQRNH